MDELECTVCLCVFVDPRMLPCGHTLCEACIDKLIRGRSLQCPEDRKTHSVPKQGVKGFPPNYSVVRQLDKRCKQCRKVPPESDCPHCGAHLCLNCVSTHISRLEAESQLDKLKTEVCQAEGVLVEADRDYSRCEDALLKEIEGVREILHAHVDARITELQGAANNYFKAQHCWSNKVRSKLTHIQNFHADSVDAVAVGQHATDIANVNEEETMEQVKSHCTTEINQLKQIMNVNPKTTKVYLSYNKEEIQATLKKIGDLKPTKCVVKPGKPRVIGSKGTNSLEFDCPADVCQCPVTNHIIVADSSNHRIQILAADYSHISNIIHDGQGRVLGRPWYVAVTVNGDIVVITTNERVLVYSKDGSYKQELPGPWGRPSGVTTDREHIYVCDSSSHTIRVFDLDGKYVRDIGGTDTFSSGPFKITSSKTHLVVSFDSIICIMDKQGKLIHRFSDIVKANIKGMAFGNKDIIYITSHNKPVCVVKDMKIVQTVGACGGKEPWQLLAPWGLTTANNNQLVVANFWNGNLLVYDIIC